jgi:hypothetical protein
MSGRREKDLGGSLHWVLIRLEIGVGVGAVGQMVSARDPSGSGRAAG